MAMESLPTLDVLFGFIVALGLGLLIGIERERRKGDGIPPVPPDATPWQMVYRRTVNSLAEGATLEGATAFRQIAKSPPRHNH